jgi:LDH2 family malate/lactate/ureidoglycolate dehydrogenase
VGARAGIAVAPTTTYRPVPPAEHTASPVHGKDRVAKGACFLAVEPAAFPHGESFATRLDALIDDVCSAEPAEGVDRVLVPGQLEHALRARRLAEGIPLAAATRAELARFAEELGVAPLADAVATAGIAEEGAGAPGERGQR